MQWIITITAQHVNDMQTLGSYWHVILQCMGRLQAIDIGKRVYISADGSFVQVENDEQLNKRLAKN